MTYDRPEGEATGGVIVDEEGNAHEVDVLIYATGGLCMND